MSSLLELELTLPSCTSWNYDQVADWISSIGFSHYKECFRANMINGKKLIRVDGSTLPSMGVTDFEDIKSISRLVRDLLGVEPPDWSKSITLPPRDDLAMFLEQKSHSGEESDRLRFEPPGPNPAAKTGALRLVPIRQGQT
eukprot:m.310538 g.310538  ORF g.310538 m.310538 type:complete len:141 (+) comp52398_c0_seq1:23-445(+)